MCNGIWTKRWINQIFTIGSRWQWSWIYVYFFLLNNYIHILLFIVFTSLIYLSISAHRDLLEYYLEKEVIEISVNEKNMSLAKIRFVFTRRVQYHLTGTFLQVSCLLLILLNYLGYYHLSFQKCIKISSHYRHLFYYLWALLLIFSMWKIFKIELW